MLKSLEWCLKIGVSTIVPTRLFSPSLEIVRLYLTRGLLLLFLHLREMEIKFLLHTFMITHFRHY